MPGKTFELGKTRAGAVGAVAVVPAWVTEKLLPAMVALPVRAVVKLFAVQETVMVLGPLPLVGETVSQEPFPDAVQAPP